MQRVLCAVGRVGLLWPCTFPLPNTTFIAMHNPKYVRLGVAAAAKTLGLYSFPKGPPVPQTVPYGLPPLFSCTAPCGIPLCTRVLCIWVEFPCVWAVGIAPLGALFSRDWRLAVLPISLFLLRFVWRESNRNKKNY